MGTRGLLCFLAVCLVLSSVSGFDILKTMKDLIEKVQFGKSVPRAGLLLLCWLLGQGKIDNNGKLLLNFNPTNGDYGFHRYNNYEKTFPVLSNTNYAYYSLGNLNSELARTQLPEFITQDFKNYPGHRQRNIDRIMIRVDKRNPRVVDEVYVTQHYYDRDKGSDYDINLTYKISTELLKEIEELCNPDNNNDKKRHEEDPDDQRFQRIKGKFANDPPLTFLYEAGYDTGNEYKQHSKSSYYHSYRRSDANSPTPIEGYEASVQLFVKNGLACARLYVAQSFANWKNVFRNSWVGFYTSDDANKYKTYQWITNFIKKEPSEESDSEHYDVYEYESNLYVSHGVQLRFMLYKDVVSERARTEPWEVPQSFFTWTKLFITLFIVCIVGVCAAKRPRQRRQPAPHFVQVSHGRPGF